VIVKPGEIEALLDNDIAIDRPAFARPLTRVQQHIFDDRIGTLAVLRCVEGRAGAKLTKLISASHPGIVLNEHYDGDGAIIFKQACTLGCEGKVKNLAAPAIKREAEEDWVS
jgi:hypothetical protein